MTNEDCKNIVSKTGILPLFYHDDVEVCKSVFTALVEAGINIIEFTNRGEFAKENFKALVEFNKDLSSPITLCVGTVATKIDATYFIDAGASFLISPFYEPEVHQVCKEKNCIYVPGCMTPTEIHTASKNGCLTIKLFPGNALSPSYLSGIVPLFPRCSFIVTGGVTTELENLSSWFGAGAIAVGMGSNLISKSVLVEKNYTALKEATVILLRTSSSILHK